MNRITTFDFFPAYRTLRVCDASFELNPGWDLTSEQRHQQELSARQWRSICFSTLGDCTRMTIEVWYANAIEEIRVRNDTIRAILVPFSCSGQWKVEGGMGQIEMTLSTYPGNHALLFELKLRNDEEYLSSPEYQEDVEGGFSQEYAYLTLYPHGQEKEPIQPEIVRADVWSAPPYELGVYERISPGSNAYWVDF